MLLERDKVEVQVLYSVLFKQILSNETVEVDSGLGEGVVLVEGGVSLNRTEVAPVVAHVQ